VTDPFPVDLINMPQRAVISVNNGLGQPMGMLQRSLGQGAPTGLAWPAANRALYMPFLIEQPCTCTQLYWYEGGTFSAANYDMGIYDASRKRLVSMGSTAVPNTVSSLVLANIADTTLNPGHYWLGMVVSVAATLLVMRNTPDSRYMQVMGVQQEALGSTVLPDPATFSNPANSYLPVCGLLLDKSL